MQEKNEYRFLTRVENETECDVLLSLIQAEAIEYIIHTVYENADEYLKVVGIPTDVACEIYVKQEQYDMAQAVLRSYEGNEEANRSIKSGYTWKQRVFCILFLILVLVVAGVGLIINNKEITNNTFQVITIEGIICKNEIQGDLATLYLDINESIHVLHLQADTPIKNANDQNGTYDDLVVGGMVEAVVGPDVYGLVRADINTGEQEMLTVYYKCYEIRIQ